MVSPLLFRRSQARAGSEEPGEAGPSEAAVAPLRNPEMLLAKLGSQRVNNIFTHLRKVAQHPLLVRNLYTDEQVRRGRKGEGEEGEKGKRGGGR